jgi:hypothetical protein
MLPILPHLGVWLSTVAARELLIRKHAHIPSSENISAHQVLSEGAEESVAEHVSNFTVALRAEASGRVLQEIIQELVGIFLHGEAILLVLAKEIL